ncbi:MAG TPA: hypothetical protein VF590_25110, partial [Isosphaeraceae bacterium]
MSCAPPQPQDEPVQPFDDPAAEIGARAPDFGLDIQAEALRRAYIGHEAAVKAVGLLHGFGAFRGLIAAVPWLALTVSVNWW